MNKKTMKAIYIRWGTALQELNDNLENGWQVEQIVSQNYSYTEDTDTRGFLIILSKENKNE